MSRTENIELLLRVSQSLEIKETLFKKRLYNYILLKIKLYGNVVKQKSDHEVLAYSITNRIGTEYLLPEHYYRNKLRLREFVIARYKSIHFIRYNTNLTLEAIGNMFGGRDHATIMHALKTISDLRETDRMFNQDFECLGEKLGLKY